MSHLQTAKLGKTSGGRNSSRDWWRSFKDGPDTQLIFFLAGLVVSALFFFSRGDVKTVFLWSVFSREVVETINIPVKYDDLETGTEKFRMEAWPIYDPHSVVAFLVEKAGLRIPPSALAKYWQHASTFGEKWAEGVPLGTWPVGIFGDSARVFTRFSSLNLAGIFFNVVLWKPQSVRISRYLLFCIPEHQLWKHHTLNTVYRRIAWSLNCLVDGMHPRCGPYNEPLAAHLEKLAGQPLQKCKLTEVRGDWSWHKKVFRFEKTSWNGIQMCHHCRAVSQSTRAEDLYWKLEQNSWDGHEFTFDEWITERMPLQDMCNLHLLAFNMVRSVHSCIMAMRRVFLIGHLFQRYIPCSLWGPLVGVRGFHPSCVRWCLMHVVHLGLLFVVNGSVMPFVNEFAGALVVHNSLHILYIVISWVSRFCHPGSIDR